MIFITANTISSALFVIQQMSRKIKSVTHRVQLLTGVARLLSDTTHRHSDVQLQVGGKIFHCHKLILALQSPYFEEKLFTSSSASAAKGQIVLNDVGADDFDKVLQFISSSSSI